MPDLEFRGAQSVAGDVAFMERAQLGLHYFNQIIRATKWHE